MTMKWKLSALALCTAATFATFNTVAATSVSLAVQGSIAPGSCTPTLSGTGVDFGSINASNLTAVSPAMNQLGSKDITMTVTCTGASTFAIAGQDSRSASIVPLSADSFIANTGATNTTTTTDEHSYGLGTVGDVKIGAYTIAVNVNEVTATNASDSAVAVDVISARSTASTWSKAQNGFMNPLNSASGSANILAFSNTGTLVPVALKTATIPLKITAAVQAMSNFTTGQSINLDGNAVVGIVYL